MMTMNDFSQWAQAKMDACNIHDEIETSKVMVEIIKRFFAIDGQHLPAEDSEAEI
ncbi:hypothetical protein [Desulfotomaculum nigrificans]|nr:hypothetical protein [Desulfotomaculum nigrificans]